MKFYSQFNEDKLLLDIFQKKGIDQGYFMEFGAWDGIHLSNCRMFFEKGWNGCFIESDTKRFNKLKKNYHNDKNILLLNETINLTNNSLNNIIQKNNINSIDLLSIDIDGLDLTILKSLSALRPKIIIIECNTDIPFDVNFEDTNNDQIGSSLLAMQNYALSSNYEIINATLCNLILIDKNFNNKTFSILNISDIYKIVKPLRLSWTNYGEIIFFENNILKRKEYFKIPTQKSYITFQPIPKFLRLLTDINGDGFKILKIIYSHFILILFRPYLFIRKIFNKFK